MQFVLSEKHIHNYLSMITYVSLYQFCQEHIAGAPMLCGRHASGTKLARLPCQATHLGPSRLWAFLTVVWILQLVFGVSEANRDIPTKLAVIAEKHICDRCTVNVQNALVLLLSRTEDEGERENVSDITSTNTTWCTLSWSYFTGTFVTCCFIVSLPSTTAKSVFMPAASMVVMKCSLVLSSPWYHL